MIRNIVVLLVLTFFFARCTEVVEPAKVEIGREYLPLAVGNYWIYDVTETNLRNFVYDSVHYQVRELVDAVYTNQIGEQTYKIIKSRRSSQNHQWGKDSIVVVNQFPNFIRRSQNNYSIVSLVFPVAENKEWNPYRFNYDGNNSNLPDFRYENVNKPFVLNDTTHELTLTVVQGKSNAFVLDQRLEVYSYGKGLLYKHFQIYKNEVHPVTQIPEESSYIEGKKITMKLIKFGTKE